MLRVTDELSRLQGGAWEHEGGKPFDVNRTAGFRGALTCDDEVSRSFSTQILCPGVSDPEEATTAAAEHFASQGFKETNKFESSVDGNRYVVQTLSRADGAYMVYQPGTGHSAIEAGSSCSTHPGMTERTT
ncbi:hypothetical protein [Arthrobacter sp. zg-Y179]|uniref:hypothetical protein n=1 Tax=Arthrobacter sp. zg-Y179 TaxID=2894188 RepID=UPI001E416A0C|nr:hypothetical protein [Arthrobacter sp. zg-Y179]MCC9174453.1 hypothetical protein [Arthrobacter sp. zg-Y179]